jgi:uncharacterized protein
MPNRLASATSPYLLQHAHNPVDWFEWGPEALAKAVTEDKPILVSIGYSSCHWCHVMERESFENEEVARVMNEFFVCIKVDREERPDIDAIYMDAVQALRQQGGWPLNVFLTPDQKPFFGGTYFPRANWIQLLMQINKVFRERRKDINESAEDLKNHLQTSGLQHLLSKEKTAYDVADLHKMFEALQSRFDSTWGGIEKAPKFIMPALWQWLLRYYFITKKEEALSMTTFTLQQIANGGIYDHVGGGFARYSVDERWFAPHFEKMLYDNAQLISLYSEAYAVTKNTLFKNVVYETIEWLDREMRHPEGGFYSALDADSEGMEGKFYTWTEEELTNLFGEESKQICHYYNTTTGGNWEHGRNILFRQASATEEARPERLHEWKSKLLAARSKRIPPGLDDKVLTGWNSMTIVGLTDAYKAFGDERFLTRARDAISFIEKYLADENKIYRSYKFRHSATEGFLEDYAFLIQAYASLYQVTFNEIFLDRASHWCNYVIQNFYDADDGYFHFSSASAERLIARKKEIFDNVIPAGNSVMARNLLTLGTLLDKPEWKEQSERMVQSLQHTIVSEPVYMANWGMALMEIVNEFSEVVIVGEKTGEFRKEIHRHFLPFIVTAGASSGSSLPLLEGRTPVAGQAWIYVCKNKVCRLPVEDPNSALQQLKG